jgi:hypothetical protein
MKLVSSPLGLLLALCPMTFTLTAQDAAGEVMRPSTDHRIMLRYSTFDPAISLPEVPGTLRSATDTNLWIVQFQASPTDAERKAVRELGGRLVGALPHDCQIVRMSAATASAVAVQKNVRWVGPYEPAYRLESELLAEHLAGRDVPVRKYNLVMADKRTEKAALEARIVAMGGKVVDRQMQSLLFTVELTGTQLLQAARLDEVLWIDRWTPSSDDMDNARIQGGGNTVETAGGYTGSGIRGHVYEGVEATHSDFTIAMTNVRSGGGADDHGHCTAGIVFGNGTSAPQARGMAPDARGFYTQYSSVTAGWSRNMVIDDVVNVHNCMFTTASWGGSQTTAYTATSADADDIVFDHRIPWTNSMSNLGNRSVRPEAWAKNVISIGGVQHFNNSTAADDSWLAGNGSIGPATDGRNKPDLAAYYDSVWTSDRTGAAGYTAGNSFTGFNGTSSATPIVAGHNALAIQMYTDGIFNNPLPGSGRFANRPFAQTLKALQIVSANPYTATATDNRREHVGWGFPSLSNMYNRRDRFFIVPENTPITQGATHTYRVNVLTGETRLKVCMTYLDPAGNPAAAIDRINDLTLRVIHPNGSTAYWGNVGLVGASQANVSSTGGSANTIDTVECVFVNNPAAGDWTIQITAPTIAQDAHVATGATDATYALVVNGGREVFGSGCARYIPDPSPTGSVNVIPFGTTSPASLTSLFTSNNGGSVGGAVYYDVTPTNNLYLTGLDVNTSATAGTELIVDVYTRSGTHVGAEGSLAGWTARTAAHGVAAGQDLASHLELNEPIPLAASLTYGVAIVARNFAHRYTNGTGSNQSYSDAEVSVALGSATNVPFSGSPFTPRVANTTLWYRPDTSSWTNQIYQTILRREDLGSAGTIRGLAFSPADSGRHFNRTLRIRMSHVPSGHTLSTTFATNLPTPVTVLNQTNYTWHLDANAWNEIGLDTPFNYNGTSDVVVEVFCLANHNTSNSTSSFSGFNRGDGTIPRVFAYNFAFGATPTVATGSDDIGQRIRVNFNCAVGTEFGTSCGPMRAESFGTPNRGGVAWFDVYDALPSSGVLVGLGFVPTPSPVSLSSYGFTNCRVFHDLPVTMFYVTGASGFATHAISVPNDASFDGMRILGQWFGLDASQPGGLTVSNYIANQIGIDP